MEYNVKAMTRRAGIGSIAMTALSIGSYSSLTVYMSPISQTLGVSVGEVALLFTFFSLTGMISSMFLGKLIDRFRVKHTIIASAIAIFLFFSCIAFANNIWLIYIGALFFGIASNFIGPALAQVSITWWYTANRGKMISYLNVGLAIFGMVMTPVIARVLAAIGYQQTALWQGIITGGIILLIGLFVMPERPEFYDISLGQEAIAEDVKTTQVPLTSNQSAYLKTASFWMIILATVLLSIAKTGVANNQAVLYESKGLLPVDASLGVSIYSAALLVWSPLYGALVDKFSTKTATLVNGALVAAAFALSIFLTGWPSVIITAFFAAGMSFNSMVGAIALTEVFGAKEAANLVGYGIASANVGAMIGAPLAGFIYSSTGTYNSFIFLSVTLLITSIFLIWYGTSPSFNKLLTLVRD